MGVQVHTYNEKKNDDGKWELTTKKPITSMAKYIIGDYNQCGRLNYADLSDGLKEIYKPNEDGIPYESFYVTTMEKLENKVNNMVTNTFTKLNVIIKALGCVPYHDDEGSDMDYPDDDTSEKQTFPINKSLVSDIQYALDDLRTIGQRETFDGILNEHMEYGKEYRIVFVVD